MAFHRHHALSVLRMAVPVGLALVGWTLAVSTERLEAYNRSPFPVSSVPAFREKFAPRLAAPTATSRWLDRARVPVEYSLNRGETVPSLFARLGLEGAEAEQAVAAFSRDLDPRRLRAGNRFSAYFGPRATLAGLDLTLSGVGRLEMAKQSNVWQARWRDFARTSRLRVVRGAIDGAFDSSVQAAGGPSSLAYRIAEILQWDVDFARDLKKGDRFEALYEEVLVDGKPYGVQKVIAVAYEGRGGRKEAIRFGQDGTFFDGDGQPLRKMFLRSPLRYSHITSRFSMRRFHPVLGVFRPHYGIDYGAPVGTPVQATAGGVIVSSGWERGGGNVVKVRHAGDYVTAYLHLSRFGRGIRPGTRVRQGDVIAYTGMTGLATGPHLDYRVQHQGRWIDPLSLTSVRDQDLASRQLASFRGWRTEVRRAWASGQVDSVARFEGLAGGRLGAPQIAGRRVPAGGSTSSLAR
ncbi:MAG TPA: peptidoglycan DD-metalloendopeptidase family protein [Thermoanaerobaculia bacterium]|jgi:murein DD-endopeptidase MepM/ murein hydrolase activator NlpD|nr:peptidoglycan DD-metalloendopeptidase family protein [Thermoanaerobaculia bacterium]